ncbi:hypothetical protein SLEP1_g32170 [Rubroshorea leprosula]|uniref:Prolamin-like domain-containing protein n=1 Tax=Rubroshorea leprosula TaxID=152421 RepID=A0AAV5KCH9_9ROSI|nr:hypothetical protein SLEP1_g32170 [Rubroshorea leprosula]
MTAFKIITLLVIFSLANKVVVEAIAPESKVDEGSPASSPESPPKLSPEEKKYLTACGMKITETCAEIIVNFIFFEKDWKVSTDCCRKLQLAGPNCHNRLVEKLASFPQFSKYAHLYVAKGKLAWDKCAEEAEFGVAGN